MSDHDRPIRNALLAIFTCLTAVGFCGFFWALVSLHVPALITGGALSLISLFLGVRAFIRAARGRF